MPKPSEYQEKVRQGNRMNVLSFLKHGEPVRFKDLKKDSELSPMGLYKILKDLEGNELIRHYLSGSRPVYEITKKGKSTFSKAMTLGIIMDQIEKEGGEYHHNYSGAITAFESSGLIWGIRDDVVIDKKLDEKIFPILRDMILNIHKEIYSKLKEISKIRKIDFDEIKNSKILLGFIIEYDNLIKSIREDSLENYRKMHSKSKNKPKGKFEKAHEQFLEFEKI